MNRPNSSICLVLLALLVLWPARAAADTQLEPQVKAAFVYNFTKFVEWPDDAFTSPSDPIRITIMGQGSFSRAIDAIQGKEGHGRSISVSHHEEQLTKAQILVITGETEGALRQSLLEAGGKPILTVSDMEGFDLKGGMITLVRREDKVGFIINLAAAEKAGLKISSQLLKLAEAVRR